MRVCRIRILFQTPLVETKKSWVPVFLEQSWRIREPQLFLVGGLFFSPKKRKRFVVSHLTTCVKTFLKNENFQVWWGREKFQGTKFDLECNVCSRFLSLEDEMRSYFRNVQCHKNFAWYLKDDWQLSVRTQICFITTFRWVSFFKWKRKLSSPKTDVKIGRTWYQQFWTCIKVDWKKGSFCWRV